MMPFRKILFPVDYSTSCDAVVPCIKGMLRHYAAELTLVHAYPPALLYSDALAMTNPEWPDEIRKLEEKRLRDYARGAFPDYPCQTFANVGEPAAFAHEVMERQGADLVMMGTHGRGPVRRFLLGSVAARMLHDITTPVWMGTDSALSDCNNAGVYKSVLCSVDESESARDVIQAAAAFAKSWNAQLSIVHALELPPDRYSEFSGFRAELAASSNTRLIQLKEELGIGDAGHAVVDADSVSDGVRSEALRREADLIITGRGHAQAGVTRLWSNLYSIVRHAPCPVLSF